MSERCSPVYVLVRFDLEEFDHWKETFHDRETERAEHGWLGGQLFTLLDNDRKVVLLATWDDADNAEAYFDSTEFRRAMSDAGVVRKPEVTVLEHVMDCDGEDDGETEGDANDTEGVNPRDGSA